MWPFSTYGKVVKRLAVLTALVISSSLAMAQTPAVDSEAYQAQKAAGLLTPSYTPQVYNGTYPSMHNAVSAAANRDACFIEHDPATWTQLPANDDSSTGLINLPFTFEMYGTTYNSLYVNNNGNLTFNSAYSTYDPTGFPFGIPMVAPFWGDVDTRNDGGEVWYFAGPDYFIASFINTQVFFAGTYPNLRNTFQVVITNGASSLLDPGNNVGFFYGDMGWTTGDASNGLNGFGGDAATVGVNHGNGVDFFQVGRFSVDDNSYDGPGGNEDGVHWLDNQCFQFSVGAAVNQAPAAQNLPNSIDFCAEDGAELTFEFIGPELNETVSVEVNDNGNGGVVVSNNTDGNPSSTTLSFSGLSAGSYTYTITATDNGSPVGVTTRTLTVNVEQCNVCAPELEITCPADLDLSCEENVDPMFTGMPTVSVADCWDGDITISSFDEVSNDDCESVITRTWTATSGDETAMCTQVITLTDDEAPQLVVPSNLYYTFEWSVTDGNIVDQLFAGEISLADFEDLLPAYNDALEAQGFFFPSAEDNCDENAFVFYESSALTSDQVDCPQVATIVWEFFAQDACGNMSEGVSVVCDFFDTTGPEFIDLPADLTVQCLEEVPAQAELSAEDACSSTTEVEVFTSETGNVVTTCTATAAVGPNGAWALWLPQFEEAGLSNTDSFVPVNLTFEQYDDGTAHLFGEVVNDENPNQGFIISTWYENGMGWDEWSNQDFPTSYKDDFGFGAIDNRFEDWMYYITVDGFSTLTGTGELEGTVLYLSHAPSSHYFGMQCGLGANDKNENFGMSTWFTYYGISNGEAVTGTGDINLDKECVPNNEQDCPNDTEVSYFWRATDECGNATIASQTITVLDETAPEFTVVPEDITVECDAPAVPVFEGLEATDNCVGEVAIVYLGEESTTEACTTVLTRTWAATDLCGNRAEHLQTITIVDTTAPEVTFVPEDLTIECDQEVLVVLAEGIDNCQDNVEVTYEDEITLGACPQEYTITRTFFMNDGCENVSTATQTISVVDTTAPVFDAYPMQVFVECTDVDSVPALTATDNCGEVSVTLVESLNSGGCLGVLYRIYT
ncbi:MAG: hypothetical protein P8N19_05310, partial [Flavobacteriales bacterium]|nr:hypothetical protein [Flavobacteriales bacterium]